MNDLMGHIIKPYEDDNLKIFDFINILDLNIDSPKEKFDGQNICVRITPTEILYARSPSDIDNALTLEQFAYKIKYPSFVESIRRLDTCLLFARSMMTYDQINEVNSGYISMEIIDNLNSNTLLYDDNYIIIHGMINTNTFKVNYNPINAFKNLSKLGYFTIKQNNVIDLYPYKQFISSNGISSDVSLFNIPVNIPISQLDEFIKSSIIDEFIKQEVKLLKNMEFKHNISMENQVKIQNLKKNKPTYMQSDEQIGKLYKNLDFDKASSIEGIVFFYKEKLYKLTGLYSTLNRINYKTRSL